MEQISYDKLVPKEKKVLQKLLDGLRNEGFIFSEDEDSDAIHITISDGSGQEKKMNFLKVMPDLPKVVEARIRFPDDDIPEALKKLGK